MLRRSSQPSVEEVAWPEVRKGPTGGAAPHSTWNWVFYYDTATTPQLCTVRLSCAAFSHIQRAILDNWNIELLSLNLKVNCMFLQHTAQTRIERHIHTYIHIPTYRHTYCKSNCICCIFLSHMGIQASCCPHNFELKTKDKEHIHVTFAQRHTHIHVHKLYVLTAHCTYTHRKTHTHIHTYTDIQTYIYTKVKL